MLDVDHQDDSVRGGRRVPTFYFHVCDGHRFDEAEEGHELPDVEAARREAIKSLRDLIAGDVCRGEANLGMFVEVEDANGQFLFKARMTTLAPRKRGFQAFDPVHFSVSALEN
jgi:hypothetical protein